MSLQVELFQSEGGNGLVTGYLRDMSGAEFNGAKSALDVDGFCEIRGAVTDDSLEALRGEAVRQFEQAYYSKHGTGLAYEAYIADFGPVAHAYLDSPEMRALLLDVVGGSYRADRTKSCYTYYLEGCFLAPHVDTIAGKKAVSVLTYLWVEGDGNHRDTGLKLDIYGRSGGAPGDVIASIPTREASIVIGYGREVWHGRPFLRSVEKVIVITGSFSSD